jgi:hypothetical protein
MAEFYAPIAVSGKLHFPGYGLTFSLQAGDLQNHPDYL